MSDKPNFDEQIRTVISDAGAAGPSGGTMLAIPFEALYTGMARLCESTHAAGLAAGRAEGAREERKRLDPVVKSAECFWQEINRSTASFDPKELRRDLDALYKMEGNPCRACHLRKRAPALVYDWIKHTCAAKPKATKS